MAHPSSPANTGPAGQFAGNPMYPAVAPPVSPYGQPTGVAVVPPAVAAAAAERELGELVETYPPKRQSNWIIMPLLVVSILLIWCVFPIYIVWLLFRTPNLNRKRAAQRLYVYQRGFILAKTPDTPDVWRWSEIDTVFQKIIVRRAYGMTTGTTYLYTINRRDGERLKLTNFWTDIENLGRRINIQVGGALLPAMRRALAAGQGVQFGDIVIDRTGVTGKKGKVSWAEVKAVDAAAGHVRVSVQGKFFALSSTPAAKVPNLPLFFALTKELRQGA
jgi:hypothetical protein